MASGSPTRINAQIYEEAGDWLVRQRTGVLDKGEKKLLDAWLRTSPEHIRAYFEISAIWEDAALLDANSGASAAELIVRARAGEPVLAIPEYKAQVREFNGRSTGRGTVHRRQWRPLGLALRVAASVVVVALCAGLISWWAHDPAYSTGIGEQRLVVLADGSTVELNARSEVRVRFRTHERIVELVRGQALFQVRQDAARPFLVRAGHTFVQVVGTQFDVNESHAGTIVTVVKGRVAVFGPQFPGARVAPTAASAIPLRGEDSADLVSTLPRGLRPTFISAGQQLTVTDLHLEETDHANVANATAWTHHRFVFDGAPLAEVVDEFNRYNATQLVIAEPGLANMRINAVFSSTDPSLLVRFLQAQPRIIVEITTDEITIRRE